MPPDLNVKIIYVLSALPSYGFHAPVVINSEHSLNAVKILDFVTEVTWIFHDVIKAIPYQ